MLYLVFVCSRTSRKLFLQAISMGAKKNSHSLFHSLTHSLTHTFGIEIFIFNSTVLFIYFSILCFKLVCQHYIYQTHTSVQTQKGQNIFLKQQFLSFIKFKFIFQRTFHNGFFVTFLYFYIFSAFIVFLLVLAVVVCIFTRIYRYVVAVVMPNDFCFKVFLAMNFSHFYKKKSTSLKL